MAGRVPTREAGAAELPSLTASLIPPCCSAVALNLDPFCACAQSYASAAHAHFSLINKTLSCIATNHGVSGILCQLYKR